MFPLIERYEQGVSSKEDLLRETDLKECTFHYWRNKYRKSKGTHSSFIALSMRGSSANTAMEIELPNGKRLAFTTLVPIDYLRSILELPC